MQPNNSANHRSTFPSLPPGGGTQRSQLIAFILCIFAGGLGIHRFYLGKIGTGLLFLITFGFFGLGILVDIIVIWVGGMTDGDGYPLTGQGMACSGVFFAMLALSFISVLAQSYFSS